MKYPLMIAFLVLICLSQAYSGVIAHYRFEEGVANTAATGTNSILDSIGTAHGTPSANPVYRANVAAPVIATTNQTNNLSLEFNSTSGQAVAFSSLFALHQPGDATLEFSVNYGHSSHQAIFWTRIGDDDRNRYNIFTNPSGSSPGFGFDYRDPNGNLSGHTITNGTAFALTPNDWTHIVIRRRGNTYEWFKNGTLQGSFVDNNPNLPTSIGWEISGRSCCQFSGLIDEVRLSDEALTESQFLMTGTPVPEPSSLWLLLAGSLLLLRNIRKNP